MTIANANDSRVPGVWGGPLEPAITDRVDRLFEGVDLIPITVLSWGPGTRAKGYAKRAELAAHMGEIPNTTVVTSEALAAAEPRFGEVDPFDAEELQARELADLIVVLETDESEGARSEVSVLGEWPPVEKKLRASKMSLRRNS